MTGDDDQLAPPLDDEGGAGLVVGCELDGGALGCDELECDGLGFDECVGAFDVERRLLGAAFVGCFLVGVVDGCAALCVLVGVDSGAVVEATDVASARLELVDERTPVGLRRTDTPATPAWLEVALVREFVTPRNTGPGRPATAVVLGWVDQKCASRTVGVWADTVGALPLSTSTSVTAPATSRPLAPMRTFVRRWRAAVAGSW